MHPTGGGGGGGGLSSVTTNATLSGAGTAGSPLAAVPGNYYSLFPVVAGFGTVAFLLNQTNYTGVYLPCLSVGHIIVIVGVTDAVGLYDFGFYNAAGTLIANVGAQHLPAGGYRQFAFVQGTVLFTPGAYVFAQTGNAVTATLDVQSGFQVWCTSTSGGVTSGGALGATITAPTVAFSAPANQVPFQLNT